MVPSKMLGNISTEASTQWSNPKYLAIYRLRLVHNGPIPNNWQYIDLGQYTMVSSQIFCNISTEASTQWSYPRYLTIYRLRLERRTGADMIGVEGQGLKLWKTSALQTKFEKISVFRTEKFLKISRNFGVQASVDILPNIWDRTIVYQPQSIYCQIFGMGPLCTSLSRYIVKYLGQDHCVLASVDIDKYFFPRSIVDSKV